MTYHNIDKAFIFAAGLGTRMQPLTNNTPKPLIKVGDFCLLDYSIQMIADAGIKKIALNSFYLAEQIEGHIQKYLQKGLDIKIFHESERLETGGGLVNAKDYTEGKPIITLNSDVIFRYGDNRKNPVTKLLNNWNGEMHDNLMLLCNKDKAHGFYSEGNYDLDESGFINENDNKQYIYSGLQILNTEILNSFEHKKAFSLSEVFKFLSKKKRMSGVVFDSDWLHVGCLEGLKEAEEFMQS